MPKPIDFNSKGFSAMANVPATVGMVVDKYHTAGFPLSMDQLYYILCALGYPRNDIHRKKFVTHVQEAVRQKLMTYRHLEPQGRSQVIELPKFTSVQEGLNALLKQYTVDRWKDTRYKPEIWLYAKSSAHTVSPIAFEYGVSMRSFPLISRSQHPSQPSIIAASIELSRTLTEGQQPVILYCAPYSSKLTESEGEILGQVKSVIKSNVVFVKVGVTAKQVKSLNLIPGNINSTAIYDVECIDPPMLADSVRSTLRHYVDEKKFKKAIAQENADLIQLASIVDSTVQVVDTPIDGIDVG